MKSMTGYAQSQYATPNCALDMSLNSVNRKQLDIRFNLPEELSFCEMPLRKFLQKHLTRGAIYVKVAYQSLAVNQQINLNQAKLQAYIAGAQEIHSQDSSLRALSIGELLALEGVQENTMIELNKDELQQSVLSITKLVIDKLIIALKQEGQEVIADLTIRREVLHQYMGQIEIQTPEAIKKHHQRLTEKLAEFTSDIDTTTKLIEREIVIYMDRCDITEELVRLDIHLKSFKQLLEQDNDNGRELDFLMQELGREINTIGSKSQDAFIANFVVKFKTELEKCREQIQNLA